MRFIWESPSLDEAVPLTAEGFRRPVTDALVEDVRAHLAASEHALCVRDDGRLVCYMLFTVPADGILYIAGTLITEPMQGHGIKTAGTVLAFERFHALRWLAGRTQSSVVWASATKVSSELYPRRDAAERSPECSDRPAALEVAQRVPPCLDVGVVMRRLLAVERTAVEASVDGTGHAKRLDERGEAV